MTKKNETTENVPATQQPNALAMFGGEDHGLIDPKDLRLPQIGIIHQPTGMFILPDGTNPKTIKGVIVHAVNVNAYWQIPFDQSGGGSVPDCYSLDGVTPDYGCMDVQAEHCAKCPQNVFNKQTGTKNCKNKKRLHIMFEGMNMPFRLTTPVTSCEPFNVYASGLIARQMPYPLVVTTIGLSDAKNKDGIAFQKLTFKWEQDLPQEDWQGIKDLVEQWKPIMNGQSFDSSEM